MLIKCDAAQLEWRVKVWMAQDEVGIKEIVANEDLHTDNQKFFGLPSRLIAKIYIYRQIFADSFGDQGYRGPAYAYANDPDFMSVSKSVKYWEAVTDKFFTKYKGVHAHSIALIREATTTGKVVNPSGRFYKFEPKQKWNGTWDWPRTDILNYPVQGLSADFMSLARRDAFLRFSNLPWVSFGSNFFFINTVHDDIELDVANDPEVVYNSCIEIRKSFQRIPQLFEQHYGTKVNVPFDAECKIGFTLYETGQNEKPEWNHLIKFKPESFEQDWEKLITNAKNFRDHQRITADIR